MSFQSPSPTLTATPVGSPQAARTGREADRICVVVPCYNEAARLQPAAFLAALRDQPALDLLMVNDGSRDQTIAVLAGLARRAGGRIRVLDLPRNGGKAEAVRQGLTEALRAGYGIVGYWDADLATPLDDIADFARVMRRLPDVEVVFGSRRALLGHRIRRTLRRRIISRICSWLARLAVRQSVGDTQCGAKLLRNTPDLHSALAEGFTAGWLFDVELFSRITRNGGPREGSFYEYPLPQWTEVAGSKVSTGAVLASGVRMLRLIAGARLPGITFGVPAGQPANLDRPPRQGEAGPLAGARP